MIGRGCERWGAISKRLALSCKASLTSLYCSKSNPIIAFCRYLTPPWMSLVLRLLVPEEKSSFSTKATFKPRVKGEREGGRERKREGEREREEREGERERELDS